MYRITDCFFSNRILLNGTTFFLMQVEMDVFVKRSSVVIPSDYFVHVLTMLLQSQVCP